MRTHRFDPVSFVPGIVLAAFALVVMIGGATVTNWNFSWVGPTVLIVLGLTLLLASRRRREARWEAVSAVGTGAAPEDERTAELEPESEPEAD